MPFKSTSLDAARNQAPLFATRDRSHSSARAHDGALRVSQTYVLASVPFCFHARKCCPPTIDSRQLPTKGNLDSRISNSSACHSATANRTPQRRGSRDRTDTRQPLVLQRDAPPPVTPPLSVNDVCSPCPSPRLAYCGSPRCRLAHSFQSPSERAHETKPCSEWIRLGVLAAEMITFSGWSTSKERISLQVEVRVEGGADAHLAEVVPGRCMLCSP